MSVVIPAAVDGRLTTLKALADEKRLRIVALLAGGERCVCELQEALDCGQSLLSFHLKTLKIAGIVRDRREGRWIYYALNRDALAEVEGFFHGLRTSEEPDLPPSVCCD